MFNAVLILLAYAAGGSIFKWVIDFHVNADSFWRTYETWGEEMWNREPLIYIVLITIWPAPALFLSVVEFGPYVADGFKYIGRSVMDLLPDKSVTHMYEDTYKRLTDR